MTAQPIETSNPVPVGQEDLAKAEQYWKQVLQGFRVPTPLLSVAPAPGTAFPTEPRRGQRTEQLPAELTAALRAFAQQQELTLETLLHGAFAALLGRYSGEEDVVFGAVRVSSRFGDGKQTESPTEPAVNPLPFRARVSADITVLPFLKKLRAQRVAMRPHEGIPLGKVWEWSDVARWQPFFSPPRARAVPTAPETEDGARGLSLFESILVYVEDEGASAPQAQTGNAVNREMQLLEETQYPLALCAVGGQEVVLNALYLRPRFDDATIERLFGHLQTLLAALIARPEQRVMALPVLSEAEHRQVIFGWNDTATEFPRDRCIHQLFEAQVERTPDATALVWEGKEIRYRDLNERANQLAHYLRSLGIGPDVLVGICIERSANMIVGVLGITKAGGAYVPLDPAYPKDRLAFMVEDTKAPVILTQQNLLERFPETNAQMLCLDQLDDTLAHQPTDNVVSGVKPGDLAYVIYTSGSTGKPKGVVLRHSPVVNLIDWVNKTYGVGAGDRLLFVTSLNFDLSVYDIFGSLAAGSSIRVTSSSELRDPERLLQILCQEPITFWDSAPPQLQQVAPFFVNATREPSERRLRLVFLSGDWIPVPLPDAIRATFPAAQVVSLGGATEAAIWSNFYPVGVVNPKWPSIPYGKPIQNAHYHVLDRHLNPLPIGVPGELHIGGSCLADGYLNRAELSAEKFIPDPFFKESGAKLYKTGDLARYYPDGNIEFQGRMDFQVKIRGFRIELGEIEAVLGKHHAVRECLVTALKDESGDRYLCAYFIPRPGQSPSATELRKFLQDKLPAHMVPPHFVPLEVFPLNPNGKIDRKALPLPSRERRDEAATFTAPRDATEQAVAKIWAEILGIERVGIDDDFFALGGHSLKATQVVSRIRQQLKVELPLPVFFKSPTIAGLSSALQQDGARVSVNGTAIMAGPADQTQVTASFAQRRLWFLDQLGQDREVYNIPYTLRIRGPQDERVLQQAFDNLAARHPSLRTTFADDLGQPVQVIAPPGPVEISLIDLTARPPAEREEEAQRLAYAESRQIFDLAKGPLWRVKLVRLDAQDHLLIWTMHHIISDGWSMWLLFNDLRACYEAANSGRPANLPALPIQYADFSRWQRQWLQGEVLEKQLTYWKKRLGGPLPTLQLPMSRTRPRQQTFSGAIHTFALPPALTKALEELGRKQEATSFMTLLAAFKALLRRYSGQDDILVGTPIANRNRAEIEGVVGFFVNTLVVRTDLSGDPTFRELLRRIRQETVEAFAHQDLPFDLLVQELHPDRSSSHQPIFQVLFNYLHAASQTFTSSGLTWTTRPVPNGTSKFDLTMMVEETPEGLQSYFEYNTALFEPDAIARMAGHLVTLLEGFAADPDRKLSQFPLLTEAERKLLLVDWNNTQADYPRDRCVHQLFEEQAARTPERTAVVFGDRQLTFRELNERANQLAHHLKALGVGPEVLVGLYHERSVEMVVGLLGILKAGGAYVPLDPNFPKDRLAFYVEDSAMPVLVTQQRLVSELPAHKAKTVCIDTDWPAITKNGTDNLGPTSTADNRVYVIYTSGSTGKPKGVQVLQGALSNFLNSMRKQPGLTENDTLLAVTTLSFDIHALEVWLPLLTGARLIVVSKDIAQDGVKLLQLVEQTAATVLQATPATWRLLLEAGWKETKHLKALCGGEPMTVELAQKMLARVGSLWNMYGPTETTVWSTIYQVPSVSGPIPIGRPIDNTQVYLVDQHNNPVPVGVVGELLLGGDGLARGYLNREELTKEKFIPDVYSGRPGARVYRTGDLARYLPDGNLECLGRVDHQVKVRGYRIELGEIETRLSQHPGVQVNVVVARKDEDGADYLAAYVVPQPGKDCRPEVLRPFLAEKLPDYMVPSYFVVMESFPLTPNGKIDRKALPVPQQQSTNGQAAGGRTIVAPRNDAERDLAAIWEEVLKVKPISVADNFFDLGGHSFLAAVLMAKIRQQLGHTVPLGTLFSAPTVEKLAAVLTYQLEAATSSSIVPLHEEGSKPPLFMIAGVGGHVFTFHKFARLLGEDQPVYGVKAIGVDGTTIPPDTIEGMAAHYVKEIMELRPHGPYLLSGFSIGAIVAYEVAVQLRALGHEVGAVVVFDMFAPGYPRKLPRLQRLWLHFRTFLSLGLGEKKAYIEERLDKIRVRVRHWLGQDIRNAPEIKGVEGFSQDNLKRVWVALVTAQQRYHPHKQFDGKVVLFKAEEGFKWAATILDDPLFGWGQWALGGVKTQMVPGTHMEIFHDKNIRLVAQQLLDILNGAKGNA
jgi:amino acid adenylation domain-containing protein